MEDTDKEGLAVDDAKTLMPDRSIDLIYISSRLFNNEVRWQIERR